MSNEQKMVSVPFQRENRYIVIKRSRLTPNQQGNLEGFIDSHGYGHAEVNCLVLESDWPEYEPAWAAIEARVTGKPAAQHHVGGTAEMAQRQGEPVAYQARHSENDPWFFTDRPGYWEWRPLYTHPGSGEVERLKAQRLRSCQIAIQKNQEMKEYRAEVERLRTELAQCESMAAMVTEREWAEHVGTGDVSRKVEAAFTQLYNELHEAGEKLAEREALLRRWLLLEQDHLSMHQETETLLSASAEPSDYLKSCKAAHEALAKLSAQKCETCDGHGAVGNILNAEPCPDCSYSAPVERDERAEFEVWAKDYGRILLNRNGDLYEFSYTQEAWVAWQARSALERKPGALVAQLQADLTQRDERVDDLATRLAAQTELLKQLYDPLTEAAMEYDDKFEPLAEEVAELIKIEDAAAQESVEPDHTPTITIPPCAERYDGSDNGVD